MPRSLAVLLACGLLILSSLALATGARAATIAPTTTCSNGAPTTAGLGVICEVTVVNTITATGGTATVTVRECHGAANDAEADCMTTTDVLSEPVTAVTQCNDILTGGSTLECSVDVTNNFVGFDPSPTAATVNQCVGSSQGGRHPAHLRPRAINDQRDDHPVQRLGQWRRPRRGFDLHGDRHPVRGPGRDDQPMQRFRQWRRSLHRLLGEHREQPGRGRDAGPDGDAGRRSTPAPGSTPRITPPTTDTTTGVETPGSGSLQIALLAISVLALLVLVATLRPIGLDPAPLIQLPLPPAPAAQPLSDRRRRA